MPIVSSIQKYGFATTALPKTSVTFTLPNLAGNGANTIANEIYAKKNITIKGFAVLLTSPGTVNVYYKAGTIAVNYTTADWTNAGSAVFSSTGFQTIPITLNINVPVGTSLSFIISSAGLSYTDGVSVGTSHASNTDLEVRSGYGSTDLAPPLANVFQPRNFNGAITYEY